MLAWSGSRMGTRTGAGYVVTVTGLTSLYRHHDRVEKTEEDVGWYEEKKRQ